MTPKHTDALPHLFDRSLFGLIDMNHPLVNLAGQLDWESLRREVAPSFCDDKECPVSVQAAFDQRDWIDSESWIR